MKKNKTTLILNTILTVIVCLSVAWMFSGLKFTGQEAVLTEARWLSLKYYTVDSNILMGIVAFIAMIYDIRAVRDENYMIPRFVYVLKLVGTVGVTITMLVTVFFLAPTSTKGYFSLFTNSNFFLHFANPLLAIVTFVGFERTDLIKFKHCLFGMMSLGLYACFYVINCLINAVEDIVPKKYDWYGFFIWGVKSVYFVLPIILLVTFLVSVVLWVANRRRGR